MLYLLPLLFLILMTLPVYAQGKQRPLSITLTSAADILITRADGKRIGRDPSINQPYNEIPDAEVIRSPRREPVYDIPPGDTPGPMVLKIVGRASVNDAQLAITGPNFVFGINGIVLAKGSVVTVRISPTGELLEYSSDRAGAVPHIVLGTDPVDPKRPSWVFDVHRGPFSSAGSTIRVSYLDQKTYAFGDDGKQAAAYDLKIKQINANGKEQNLSAKGARARESNRFILDLSSTKTKNQICLHPESSAGGCLPFSVAAK